MPPELAGRSGLPAEQLVRPAFTLLAARGPLLVLLRVALWLRGFGAWSVAVSGATAAAARAAAMGATTDAAPPIGGPVLGFVGFAAAGFGSAATRALS